MHDRTMLFYITIVILSVLHGGRSHLHKSKTNAFLGEIHNLIYIKDY